MNICFAHRGWSSRAPENTLAAIKLVLQEPAIKGIEIDVQLSKDGIPVVIHDLTLERTTNSNGFVKDYNYEELAKLDAGSWFSPEFAGEKMPTLEEVLALVGGKVLLNIELKTAWDFYPGLEEKVVRLVKKYNLERQVFFTSFDHQLIKKIKYLNTGIKTGLIMWGKPILLEEQLQEAGATVLSIGYQSLTANFITQMINKGFFIITWTVDEPELIKMIANLDPRIHICTNYPERVLQFRQNRE